MDIKLVVQALVKFFVGMILIALLIFIPAGSIFFWNGWIFMGLLFIPMFLVGLILIKKNPYLLQSRLKAREKSKEQGFLIFLSGIMFILGFIVAGCNYRFKWIILPSWLVCIGGIIFIISYLLYGIVLKENTFLSRTIEVQKNQKVIDTGLYGLVRHPMYCVSIFLFLSSAIVLNSLPTFVIFLVYPILIFIRMNKEEIFLEKELEGYREYKKKVKYKIIPYIY